VLPSLVLPSLVLPSLVLPSLVLPSLVLPSLVLSASSIAEEHAVFIMPEEETADAIWLTTEHAPRSTPSRS